MNLMNAVEEARRKASLLGDIARCHYGQPNYPFLKGEWLDAVDELNAAEAAQRAMNEKARERREEKNGWRGQG